MKSLRILEILTVSVLTVSCNNDNQSNQNDSSTPVWMEEVQNRTIEEYVSTTGTAKATKTTELMTEISGDYYLQINPTTRKPYKLGDKVKKGAVIVRLENKEHRNNNNLESKKLQVSISEKEWEGEKILLEKGGTTQIDVNNAENSFISAKVDLDNAYISLEQMNIRAPFDGIIVELPYYTRGVELVSNSSVVTIMDYSKMYLEAEFPENAVEKLEIGQHIYVTNYNIKLDTFVGTLAQLSPAIDEETRTFYGFLEIDNPDLILRPGMFVKADVVTMKKENVPSVSKNIIRTQGDRQFVFTVERSTVAIQNILKTGISNDEYIEITEGLEAGQSVVKKGQEWLRNRSKVTVMQ